MKTCSHVVVSQAWVITKPSTTGRARAWSSYEAILANMVTIIRGMNQDTSGSSV